MSTSLLKLNVDILVEVVQGYERLVEQQQKARPQERETLQGQVNALKNQMVYLLTAIRKAHNG